MPDAPRLLYLVSEDWAFLINRLPMARAAREAGFEVHVATRVGRHGAAITAEGFVLHPIPYARGRLSPPGAWRTIAAVRRIHRQVRPAIVHHVGLQASILGSIASYSQPAARVNALTGLGFIFTSTTARARTLRPALRALMRRLFDRQAAINLVQNPDDRAVIAGLGIAPDRIALIPGSGVDTDRLVPTPEPDGPPTVAFVGRLLDDKGIRALVAAHQLLRARGSDVRLLIAGTPDPANPASVTQAEATSWNAQPGVEWLGHVEDIGGLWGRAHIAVLPSRREGLPGALLEAAACGRPLIASDVPGCREIVIQDETGLLVPADDPAALADAIETLARSPALRARYGAAARARAVDRFSAAIVGRDIVALYRSIMTRR